MFHKKSRLTSAFLWREGLFIQPWPLLVPLLLRQAQGPDHRPLIPQAALLGAALLVLADLVARTIVAPAELPIGILTALVGAPVFLWMLLQRGAR